MRLRHPIKLPQNNLTQDERLFIREIQEYLRLLSFHDRALLEINVDGIYGPDTHRAVQQFQRQYHMDATGVMNRVTWELLFAAYRAVLDPSFPPQPPLAGDEADREPEWNISRNDNTDTAMENDMNRTMETQPNRVG